MLTVCLSISGVHSVWSVHSAFHPARDLSQGRNPRRRRVSRRQRIRGQASMHRRRRQHADKVRRYLFAYFFHLLYFLLTSFLFLQRSIYFAKLYALTCDDRPFILISSQSIERSSVFIQVSLPNLPSFFLLSFLPSFLPSLFTLVLLPSSVS